jgi:hypothetical protein
MFFDTGLVPKTTVGFFLADKNAMFAFAAVAVLTGSISVNLGKVFIMVGIYHILLEPGSIAI